MNENYLGQVCILRSPSGGGKSTLITCLEKLYDKPALTCSADDYHYFNQPHTPENYKFDFNNLHIAHKQCKQKFVDGLNSNTPLIIIDNTNIKLRDYKFYYLTAREHLYNVTFHSIKPGTVEQHFKSNVHNVPRVVLEQMITNFKPVPTEINGELTDEVFYDFNELRKNKLK